MNRRRTLIVLTILLALVTVSCRREDNSTPEIEQQVRIIATANTTDDPAALRITWFPTPCETFDRVEVELDDQYANLRVHVTVDINTCPETTTTEAVVDLGEPLGDRSVWDRAFGSTVALDTNSLG